MFLLDLICLFLLLRRDLIVLVFVPVRQIYVQSYRQKNTISTHWMCLKFVSNKGKKRISKRNVISKESTSNCSEKQTFLTPWHARIYARIRSKKLSFSGKFSVFLLPPFLRFVFLPRSWLWIQRRTYSPIKRLWWRMFWKKKLHHRCSAGFSILTMTFLLSIMNHLFTVIYCFYNGFE